MAQGEASIARGSHVEMRVEHGTSGPEIDLGPVAAAWRDGLRTIRECYAALVATEPSVVGTMSIALSWRGARARPDIAFAAGSLDHSALVPCTRRALGGALPADAPRAGSVHVTLEFSNTAAAGVAISEGRREASRDGLAVTRGPGDRRSVRGQTLQGEVSYEVWATGGADDDAVRAAADMVRTSVGLLLDCRRKAGRRGRSPAGRIALSLDAGARGAATVVESSVAAPDAGPCAARAATTMGLRPPAGATLGLTIDFAPAP